MIAATSIESRLKESPKILVVDDRQKEVDLLSRLLADSKAEIHTARSGQEALSLLLRHNFVIVLLDVQMPNMDGLEVARLMRSNKQTQNIPIIFLTAYDRNDINMLQGYKLGAIDYMFKPINEEILRSKVDIFLRSYEFKKEKEYEILLKELKQQNRKLKKAEQEAIQMMKDANKAKSLAEASQKQLEVQADELLRYTKELEQFAYVATHDLRSPIINLRGLMQIFKKKGFVTSKNKILVDKISSSADRIYDKLHDLINVIAYKKTLKDEARVMYFEEILDEVKQDLEQLIAKEQAEISADFSKAGKINYIPSHLRSIMQNLLTNAIKYRSPDRKPYIRVETNAVNGSIKLYVKDNGRGIDKRKKDKVFGLFQRLTTEGDGKGMGLYITKSQVEALGGTIKFDSAPGAGTTFTVVLKNLNKRKNGRKQDAG